MTYGKRLIAVAAIASALALVTWMTTAARAQSGAKATAIAVIDVNRAFNECKEKDDIQAEATSAQEALANKLDMMKKEIAQEKADMDLVPVGSDAWKETASSLRRKVILVELEEKLGTQEIVREQIIRFEGLYMELRDVCGEVATANGYDIVLYKEPKELARTNLAQLFNQIGARKVLWSAKELDITEQVLQMLNNDWEARGK